MFPDLAVNVPSKGHKIMLSNKSVLVRCTPVCALAKRQASWRLWCGTVAVRGQGACPVGTRILIQEKHFVKVFKHGIDQSPKSPKRRKR